MKLTNISTYHHCPICDSNLTQTTYYEEHYVSEEYFICPVCKYTHEYAYGHFKLSKMVCGKLYETVWSHVDSSKDRKKWFEDFVREVKSELKCYRWQRRRMKKNTRYDFDSERYF